MVIYWKSEDRFTMECKYTQSGNSIVVENDVYNSNIQPKVRFHLDLT